jgi:hypothetical protein
MTDHPHTPTDTQTCRFCSAPYTHPFRGCCATCLAIGYAHVIALIALPPGKRDRQ